MYILGRSSSFTSAAATGASSSPGSARSASSAPDGLQGLGEVGSGDGFGVAVALVFLATDSICSQDAAESEAAMQREAVPLSLGRILARPVGLTGPDSYFPAEAFILIDRPPGLGAVKEPGSGWGWLRIAGRAMGYLCHLRGPWCQGTSRSHFSRLFPFQIGTIIY